MTGKTSLQRQLSLGLTLGLTLLWLVAVTASGLVMQRELDKALDSALEETAQRILPLAVVEILNQDSATSPQRIASLQPHDEYLTYLIRDETGAILLRSHDADQTVFGEQPRTGFVTTPTHRIYGAAAVSNTVHIEIAEPLAHRHTAMLQAVMALLLPLALLIPVSLAGVWWLVRRSLRNIVAYRDAIESRGAGDLSPVPTAALPTEIEPIAAAVNQLLEKLRRALDAERSFTANSAHELRTPLATALAQLQRLQREIPAGPLQDKTVQIEASLHGLSRLSEKLMQLAKAEGAGLVSATAQDIVPTLVFVVGEFRRATKVPLLLSVPENRSVLSCMDQDAFAILVRNLIDNALKHGAAGKPVEISLATDGTLRVINAGAIVPADTLAQLRGRFVRSNTDASGTGLGLAIADTIASGAGAQLTLQSPATGRADGFEAIVNIIAS